MKLCPNCGATRHFECCRRCGALIARKRRGVGFCTDRCEREQKIADDASRDSERDAQLDAWRDRVAAAIAELRAACEGLGLEGASTAVARAVEHVLVTAEGKGLHE